MPPTNIFMTGATGYIGGDFLAESTTTPHTWNIACLVRNPAKATHLTARFPHIRLVAGDLDDAAVIEDEASRAHIVLHFANCDHVGSARAIARGLARSVWPAAFWIHTSGAGILTHENFARACFGVGMGSDGRVYDDWEGVGELVALPDRAIHRHVDKIVLGASRGGGGAVRTAIVCPPCIFGEGRGSGNTRSVQVYDAARTMLAERRAFQVGSGDNIWHEVHVRDLSKLYVLLVEAAEGDAEGRPATWNETGYYLAENGEYRWGDVLQGIADEAHKLGLLDSNVLESLSADESKKLHRWFPYLCATTSRGVSRRARNLLGWKPTEGRLQDEIPNIVLTEARSLGLVPKRSQSSLL